MGSQCFWIQRAAEVIWAACGEDGASGIGEDAALGAAYMLLTGYALENVIKALLLTKRPELREPGPVPRWPGGGGGHNLPMLFDAGAVGLGSDERRLLDRLRAFVVWRGRYPMPTKPETIRTERALSWVTSPLPVGVSRNDHTRRWVVCARGVHAAVLGCPRPACRLTDDWHQHPVAILLGHGTNSCPWPHQSIRSTSGARSGSDARAILGRNSDVSTGALGRAALGRRTRWQATSRPRASRRPRTRGEWRQ
jgi:hypothetical protein